MAGIPKDINTTYDVVGAFRAIEDELTASMIRNLDHHRAEELEAGQQVYLQNAAGQPFPVKVVEKDETTITFDANHEMAGKELNFTIELVSVEE